MAFLESITMIALLIRVDFFFQRRGNESQLLLSEERERESTSSFRGEATVFGSAFGFDSLCSAASFKKPSSLWLLTWWQGDNKSIALLIHASLLFL